MTAATGFRRSWSPGTRFCGQRCWEPTGGAPNHPQCKIERWHQTLKNRILLEDHYLPGDLEASIGAFVERYNHHRYHESLGNLKPADVYFGREIVSRRVV